MKTAVSDTIVPFSGFHHSPDSVKSRWQYNVLRKEEIELNDRQNRPTSGNYAPASRSSLCVEERWCVCLCVGHFLQLVTALGDTPRQLSCIRQVTFPSVLDHFTCDVREPTIGRSFPRSIPSQ